MHENNEHKIQLRGYWLYMGLKWGVGLLPVICEALRVSIMIYVSEKKSRRLFYKLKI